MTALEKILQEIEELEKISFQSYTEPLIELKHVKDTIKKHLSCENHTETTRQSRDNGWIPCNPEKMPEKEVMCCDKYGELLIGWLSNTNLGYVCESEECTMYDVVAWMEKPEPYKPPLESAEEKSMREREEFFKDGE